MAPAAAAAFRTLPRHLAGHGRRTSSAPGTAQRLPGDCVAADTSHRVNSHSSAGASSAAGRAAGKSRRWRGATPSLAHR
eukprot:CAMPEP_0181385444 /NCGR_PEP_ID=MMETSP1106-20121128/22563_1 /TAXON_ID=81844 /ORGANISM="Mantoniella antarctica, Strain SL-175" /LENGTH=78 /DNA_ID=CAMNT_0023505505 /DNA_START=120 /DNA_END=353 /DNA_ORIENTATION=+